MTNELDAWRAIEILENDELEQENAAMGEQMDADRAVFEAYMLGREHPVIGWIDGHWFVRGDDPATYANDYVQGCWVMWQARSLPVGVPDGLLTRIDSAIKAFTSGRASMHVPPEPDDVDMVLGECWKLVNALIAAPTVKAEQGQCNCPGGSKPNPEAHAPNCPIRKAPSLPAAGLAGVNFWDWLERAYRSGGHGEEPKFTKYNMEVAYQAGMSAQAALSAQQSAPERVSVPDVSELQRVIYSADAAAKRMFDADSFWWSEIATIRVEFERFMRALLASHARGEA